MHGSGEKVVPEVDRNGHSIRMSRSDDKSGAGKQRFLEADGGRD
jgi:hypothetical protein